jgi:hypothetical protein
VTLDSQDSPRPGLEGSHHLPPYSILCASPQHLHRNGFLSWDSQGGAPKLSRFGLLPLCRVITLCLDLRSRWDLKQTCSSCWELSNGISHTTCTHRGRFDYRLLVVGSQIASLTFDLFFGHNLCCRCPNGSCEPIFDIYTSIAFQWYKEHFNARCFDPLQLNFEISGILMDSQVPISGVWMSSSHSSKSRVVTIERKRVWAQRENSGGIDRQKQKKKAQRSKMLKNKNMQA